MSITPILNGRWVRSETKPARKGYVVLEGYWWEDFNKYYIEVPVQLAYEVLKMQNHFANLYSQHMQSVENVKETDHELFQP